MKHYKKVFLIVILLVFIPGSNVFAEKVEITNIKVKSLIADHSFVGVNWFDDNPVFRALLTNPSHLNQLGEILKKNNIDMIRYPGGHNVWTIFWDIPTEKIYTALSKLPKSDIALIYKTTLTKSDRLNFFDFLKFCKKNNIKATIQVNTQLFFDSEKNEIIPLKSYKRDQNDKKIKDSGLVNWNLVDKAAQYAAEEVKWVRENGFSDVVEYWELGNEEYNRFHLGAGYTGDEYAKVAAKFIQEMQKNDSTIKLILTNSAVVVNPLINPQKLKYLVLNDWTKQILNNSELKKNQNSVFAVSNHIYRKGNIDKNSSFVDFMNYVLQGRNLNIEDSIRLHLSILGQSNFPSRKIFINEFNSHSYENMYAHTWLAGLANAEVILSCANTLSCDHMDYHNLLHMYGCYNGINQNQGFGLIHYARELTNPFIVYPDAVVISILNQYLKGDILKSSSSTNDLIPLVINNGQHIVVFLLNKKANRSIDLDFLGFNKIQFLQSKTVGVNVPLDFTNIARFDSCKNPAEFKILNTLQNVIVISPQNGNFSVKLPANTLSLLVFSY